MTQLHLELPKTLQSELKLLAATEGISLEGYIVYALTQKVTLEKATISRKNKDELTPEQVRLLAQANLVAQAEIDAQAFEFSSLLTRLGPPATDEAVAEFLATREATTPDPDLDGTAAAQFRTTLGLR